MNSKKRILALLMCICMIFTLLPFSVFADDTENVNRGGNSGVGTEPAEPTQTYNFYVDEKLYRTQTLQSGDKLLNPGVPAGDGEFLGWYVDTKALSFGEKTFSSSETINVKAMFRGVNYFYFMSSTEDTAVVVATKMLHESDAAITDFSDVVVPLDGTHGVAGWCTDKALMTPVAELSYDTANTAPIPLYPKIEEGFWITFESNGGTYIAPKFFAGSASDPKNEPTKFGYDFAGWYTDSECNQAADFSEITKPTTVYAKWNPHEVTYTVIYWQENANDKAYSYKDSKQLKGLAGELTNVTADETYEGFTAKAVTQETISGDGSTIVNVYYNRNTYTIKFIKLAYEENGGRPYSSDEELVGLRITAKYGADIVSAWPDGTWARQPVELGGSTHTEYQANLLVMPAENKTYYQYVDRGGLYASYYREKLNAQDTENVDDANYELDHKVGPVTASTWTDEGDKIEIAGFYFYKLVTKTGDNGKLMFGDAKFYYKRASFNIAYMNHSENPDYVASYKYQADISDAGNYKPSQKPTGVPDSYVFVGWYFDENCSVPCEFDGRTMPAGDIAVYAKWAPSVHKVTFVANGTAIKTVTGIQYMNTLASGQIPTPALAEGEEFYGWTFDEEGTEPFSTETKIDRDLTIYAQIGNKDGYTVTYNANSGTGTVVDPYIYKLNKAAMVLSGSGLTAPLGAVFIGWNTARDGSGTMYYPGSAIRVSDNITLYAMWGESIGSLEISKTISGNAADKDKAFTFTVSLTNGDNILSGIFDSVKFENGEASFKLKAGESKTITGLPDGIGYTVTESDNSGYTVSIKIDGADAKAAQGTIAVGHKTEVAFNNHRSYSNPGIGDEITVEITGNSDSVAYDGTEHNVKGYTVKISDPRYTESDFTFTGKAEASGVNAGTYEMGLKADQFRNTNALFRNVKFIIKADGVLTITPKDLTITAGSKTDYGPNPVTSGDWTVDGLVAGDKVESVKITGSQNVPGSSANVASDAVIKNAKGEDVTKNYNIKYVDGTLTMLEVLNKEDHFNYIIGYTDGTVRPNNNITRAEVATIFFRLLTDDARANYDAKTSTFSDVANGQWYTRAIATLAKAGIVNGDPDGTFRPNDAITRAEMAAIIARFGDLKDGGKTFSDISGHWAAKYIELAASNGWITGDPDGKFRPNDAITRAETAAMINRVLGRQTESNDDLLPVNQMTNWSDNADTAAWYYRDMQEATNNHKAERVGTSAYEKWTEKLPDIDWASYQI